ncbi:EamA family transporter [Parasulfuritortus cantonensis]|uniref:EamA family transporter n=1 Tax=Parasulfuritortus cantonensis TaxID=2528202 RepID=A0A4R1BN45_9PROT|nr:DMT family transporter [Parasulfuritortus cantonensis]TCJ18943.1 EamA family transporter [Parasulfuritortus cantonensis]
MTAASALLLAVALHVTWNLLARHVPARQEFIWWALAGHLLLIGPWALWALLGQVHWDATLATCVGLSGAALAVYFLGLRAAYRHAPVALAYPVARSAPLFVALAGALLFGDRFDGLGLAGIGLSSLALVLLGASAWRAEAGRAIAPALAAALATTVYSLSDKVAVGHLPDYASRLGYISLGYLIAWLALTLALYRRSGRCLPAARPPAPLLGAGALAIGNAYALVVHAMASLPAAHAVALSNGGIVVAAFLSVFWFGERQHRRARLFWATVLAAGLALVAASGARAT